jgi:hypothetical protein
VIYCFSTFCQSIKRKSRHRHLNSANRCRQRLAGVAVAQPGVGGDLIVATSDDLNRIWTPNKPTYELLLLYGNSPETHTGPVLARASTCQK